MKRELLERTLSIVKPDAVERNLVGEVVGRFEGAGLRLRASRMIRLSREQAEGFYHVHRGKKFFDSLTTFMSSGPVLVMVLEGEGAIERVRQVMGATDPARAETKTIRRDLGMDIERNSVHGSDSPESARFEIGYFFNSLEIV